MSIKSSYIQAYLCDFLFLRRKILDSCISLYIYNMCMLSHFSHVQLFATPQTVTHQASLSMGFSRQEYWSRLPFPLPRDLPNSGIKPTFHAAPALKADSLTLSHQRSPALSIYGYKYCKWNMYITYYKCNMHIIYIHTHMHTHTHYIWTQI